MAAALSVPVAAHAADGVFEILEVTSQCDSTPEGTTEIVNRTDKEVVLYSDAACADEVATVLPAQSSGHDHVIFISGLDLRG
ncbi:hypothetical protein ACFQ71_37040 [Streptomyces sp. NPDC056534]|uniref:hypothetical protein n=1 Tax=Streptomyces sp. NPDC056534 TaxID=3345857 RepID=UPI0036A8965E